MAALEPVSTHARQLQLTRILLTALAAPLWLLGWLVAKVSLAALWVMAAVRLGWSDGRATSRRR